MHTTNINVLNYSCNHGTELDVTVWCESFYFCSFNCFSREAALAWRCGLQWRCRSPPHAAVARLVCFPANCNTPGNNRIPQSVTLPTSSLTQLDTGWSGYCDSATDDCLQSSRVICHAETVPGAGRRRPAVSRRLLTDKQRAGWCWQCRAPAECADRTWSAHRRVQRRWRAAKLTEYSFSTLLGSTRRSPGSTGGGLIASSTAINDDNNHSLLRHMRQHKSKKYEIQVHYKNIQKQRTTK